MWRRRAFNRARRRWILPAVAGLLLVGGSVAAGTETARFYGQMVLGHAQLMLARTPIPEVLQQPGTDSELRKRLMLVRDIRTFASGDLDLPDNDSYRDYVELEGDAVVWSVTAVPEFSLEPKQWCYPVVGCQSYRGYFDETRARGLGRELEAAGYATSVRPVRAYSTLGHFADPVTSAMLERDDPALAELIFHELAHQRVFVSDDTLFNESYANFVGMQGTRDWLRARGDQATLSRWQARQRRQQRFYALLETTRAELAALYQRELPPAEMRARKESIIARLETRFRAEILADEPAMARYAAWFDEPVTNARLARVDTYHRWLDSFAALYERHGGDWGAFHDAVEDLAALPRAERVARLDRIRSQTDIAALPAAAASAPPR